MMLILCLRTFFVILVAFVLCKLKCHVHVLTLVLHLCNFVICYIFGLILTFADIIHGKLDQKNSQLEVDYAIGRDIQSADLGSIVSTLQEWCDSCEAVLSCVETQINRANAEKNRRLKHKEAIEQEVNTCTEKSRSCVAPQLFMTDSVHATFECIIVFGAN
jgi:hypothetical protein